MPARRSLFGRKPDSEQANKAFQLAARVTLADFQTIPAVKQAFEAGTLTDESLRAAWAVSGGVATEISKPSPLGFQAFEQLLAALAASGCRLDFEAPTAPGAPVKKGRWSLSRRGSGAAAEPSAKSRGTVRSGNVQGLLSRFNSKKEVKDEKPPARKGSWMRGLSKGRSQAETEVGASFRDVLSRDPNGSNGSPWKGPASETPAQLKSEQLKELLKYKEVPIAGVLEVEELRSLAARHASPEEIRITAAGQLALLPKLRTNEERLRDLEHKHAGVKEFLQSSSVAEEPAAKLVGRITDMVRARSSLQAMERELELPEYNSLLGRNGTTRESAESAESCSLGERAVALAAGVRVLDSEIVTSEVELEELLAMSGGADADELEGEEDDEAEDEISDIHTVGRAMPGLRMLKSKADIRMSMSAGLDDLKSRESLEARKTSEQQSNPMLAMQQKRQKQQEQKKRQQEKEKEEKEKEETEKEERDSAIASAEASAEASAVASAGGTGGRSSPSTSRAVENPLNPLTSTQGHAETGTGRGASSETVAAVNALRSVQKSKNGSEGSSGGVQGVATAVAAGSGSEQSSQQLTHAKQSAPLMTAPRRRAKQKTKPKGGLLSAGGMLGDSTAAAAPAGEAAPAAKRFSFAWGKTATAVAKRMSLSRPTPELVPEQAKQQVEELARGLGGSEQTEEPEEPASPPTARVFGSMMRLDQRMARRSLTQQSKIASLYRVQSRSLTRAPLEVGVLDAGCSFLLFIPRGTAGNVPPRVFVWHGEKSGHVDGRMAAEIAKKIAETEIRDKHAMVELYEDQCVEQSEGSDKVSGLQVQPVHTMC
jgi:hypothetical protein